MTFASTPRRRFAAIALRLRLGLALLRARRRARAAGHRRSRASAPLSDTAGRDRARCRRAARRAPRRPPRVAARRRLPAGACARPATPASTDAPSALLRGVLAREPRNAGALVERAGLALSRHDFRSALALARRAQRLEPAGVAALPRSSTRSSSSAATTRPSGRSSALVDRKPNLSAYARVSYLRELRGDLAGAPRRAARSPSPPAARRAENVAARRDAARRPRASCAAAVPTRGAPTRMALRARSRLRPGEAGLRALAAFDGDLRGAVGTLRRARRRACRCPSTRSRSARRSSPPGERPRRARRSRSCVAEQGLLDAAGVNSDAELALFEADHGDRGARVALARRAWAAAPGVRSADALGWALTRAGRPREGCSGRRGRAASARPTRSSPSTPGGRTAAGEPRGRRRLLRSALAHGLVDAPVARAKRGGAEERAMSARLALLGCAAGGARVAAPAQRERAPARQLLRQPPL